MSVKALKSLQGNCLSVPLGIWCWTGLVWGFASLSLQQKQKTKLFPEQTVVWLSVSLMILTQQTWQLCPAPVATLQNWHTWYMREGLRSHQMAWVRMCSFLRGAAWLGWGRFLLLSAVFVLAWDVWKQLLQMRPDRWSQWVAVSAHDRASLSCGLENVLWYQWLTELHFRHEPPRKIERLTLLKSVHIFKKHRVQYEMRTLYRRLEVGFLQPYPKLFVSV